MVRRKANRRSEPEDEGQSWLVTYGDMMTLLLTFFIMILSFSSVQLDEFRMAMGSLRRSLGLLKSPPAMVARISKGAKVSKNTERLKDLESKILASRRTESVQAELIDDGVRFRISSPFLFDLGKADLRPETYDVLDEIREILLELNAPVRVEGHTDDLPIHNEEFDSNWELSATRALAVVKHFLRDKRASPGQFYIAAYGEFKPLVPNDSEENKQQNRRVEIHVGLPEFLSSPGTLKVLEDLVDAEREGNH